MCTWAFSYEILLPQACPRMMQHLTRYIPPWGVVILHIGVPTPISKTTPQGTQLVYNLLPRQHHCRRDIYIYEQQSYVLPE